jgi:hypothetical protein
MGRNGKPSISWLCGCATAKNDNQRCPNTAPKCQEKVADARPINQVQPVRVAKVLEYAAEKKIAPVSKAALLDYYRQRALAPAGVADH